MTIQQGYNENDDAYLKLFNSNFSNIRVSGRKIYFLQ